MTRFSYMSATDADKLKREAYLNRSIIKMEGCTCSWTLQAVSHSALAFQHSTIGMLIPIVGSSGCVDRYMR